MGKINIAIAGLGFGAEFIPIYQRHPHADCAAVCRRSRNELNEVADRYGIRKRYQEFDSLLEDPEIDAVHINTPIADHGWMTIAALKAGKHVASTVPMSTRVEECLEIAALETSSRKVYMMMETAVYTREFFYAKELFKSGKLGRIQFLRGSHQQNMGLPGWPAYWYGFPPMYYATHAIAPLLDLNNDVVESVRCYGSGKIQSDYAERYNSPSAVETAQLSLKDSDVVCEVTRSLFNTIRQYRESFDIYGSKRSFEWEQLEGEGPVVYSGFEDAERVEIPDTGGLLPPEIAPFTLGGVYGDDNQHTSFIQGAGHGGSHPHMAHEFIRAIKESRKSHVHAAKAANWTIAGILAHKSAIQGGKQLDLPELEMPS